MNREAFHLLARHNQWCNERLRPLVTGLNPSELNRRMSPSHDSVSGLVTHMITAQRFFLAEFRGEPFDWEATSLVPIEELLAGWHADDAELVAWFAGADEDAISGDFTRNFGEEYGEFTYPLWQEILQSFNHAIQHRAELGMLLASLGRAVPDLDLLGLMAEDWAAATG